MQETVDQPFPKLVHLRCESESEAFSQLSRHLTTLMELTLLLNTSSSKTVFDICSCTSLVRLQLEFAEDCSGFDANSHFPPEGLLAIAKSCPHLRAFVVNQGWFFRWPSGSIADVTDDLIQEFVTLLPGLSCFKLRVKTNLTHRALRILGTGCANLKHCSLQGKSFRLELLEEIVPVLFPRLESLNLDSFEKCPLSDRIGEIISHHAPCLRYSTIEGRCLTLQK